MDTEGLEFMIGKRVTLFAEKVALGVGYDRTSEGYTFVLVIRGKEYYLTSQTPIELDVRDIH